MAENPPKTRQQIIDERSKILDQKLLFDFFKITGIPADPWTPFYKTNNFIQRSLSILLAYNSTKKEMQLVGVDDDNNLSTISKVAASDLSDSTTLSLLKCDAGGRLLISTEEDLKETIVLANNANIADSGLFVSAGVDIGMHTKKTLLIRSNGVCTVSIQGSNNNQEWYSYVDDSDTSRTWSLSNNGKMVEIEVYTRFFRITSSNSSGSMITFNAELMCHA